MFLINSFRDVKISVSRRLRVLFLKDVRYSKAWKMAHFAFNALLLQPYVRSALNFIQCQLIILVKIIILLCFIQLQSGLKEWSLAYCTIHP